MSTVHVQPTSLGRATVNKTVALDDAKWVQLNKLEWTDQDGKERAWEVASRKTTSKGGIDAVAIAALLKHPSKPLSVPIILQFRPPAKSICVELPAGLIDEDESPEQAAVRELYEETGYGGHEFKDRVKVKLVGGTTPSDPVEPEPRGMTTANMKLVTLEVELREGEEEPKPHLDEGEHIEVRVTPVAELYAHLEAYEKLGYQVDARLHHWAAGIKIAQEMLS
ncbi:hypothetical protein OIO90_005093 [Microbotryomycetes sp. JL221]|nr:hypothetical protein OIO90_005093 [Microbotryomycetes sp. JL221]